MLFNCNIFADEDVMFYFLISIDMGIDRKMYTLDNRICGV